MIINEIRRIQASALLLAILTLSHGASGQTLKKCRAADTQSLALIRELQEWMTTTDPQKIASRDTVFHLPVVSSSQVVLVTDEKLCAKVVQAYAGYPAYTPVNLYVVKLGSKGYVGYDPDRKGGEFTAVHIFNTKFVRIGGWAG
jgi:hypothetical protein